MSGTLPHPVPGDLWLFAYGTLKHGFENHDRYCSGARAIVPAWAWGRLHAWLEAIPILTVPPDAVLFTGTRDRTHDLQHAPHAEVPDRRSASTPPAWRRIRGELIALPGAEARLRVLDALEGFHPRAPGHYARVLIPVHVDAGILAAWAYVVPPHATPPGDELDLDEWA